MYGFQDVIVGFAMGVLTGIFIPKLFNKYGIQQAVKTTKSIASYHNLKMALVVRTDLAMGKGKIAAQCSHATLSAYKKALKITPEMVTSWEMTGQTKVVLKLGTDDSLNSEDVLYNLKKMATEQGISAAVIHDAGRTQIASGTATVVAIGPAPINIVDQITGHLKLM